MEKLTSRRNPLCIHVKKLGSDRKYREEHGQFLCDGLKLLEEAVKSGMEVDMVITASGIPFPMPASTRVYIAERNIIDSLSQLKNAQDTLFVCGIKRSRHEEDSSRYAGTHILLDSIQDPGNLGSIIRSANAFDINSVILTGECADPYNPKTVRASMGAVFKQHMSNIDTSGLKDLKNSGKKRFIGTSTDDRGKDISGVNLKETIIAVGNEGNGLSEEILALCDEVVTIPISKNCESLNAAVAASIIMWEASGKGVG